VAANLRSMKTSSNLSAGEADKLGRMVIRSLALVGSFGRPISSPVPPMLVSCSHCSVSFLLSTRQHFSCFVRRPLEASSVLLHQRMSTVLDSNQLNAALPGSSTPSSSSPDGSRGENSRVRYTSSLLISFVHAMVKLQSFQDLSSLNGCMHHCAPRFYVSCWCFPASTYVHHHCS